MDIEELRWKKIKVLDDGFVCLVDVMGDDYSVVEAARVSYGEGTKHVSDDRTLIRYLMRHRHSTPFEMAEIKLLVRVPMDCWRQWIRHRTANVNEYSTRYSLAIDAAQKTPPNAWRLQSQSNRQGSTGKLTEWPDDCQIDPRSMISQLVNLHDGSTPGHYLTSKEKKLHELAREVYEERIEKFGIAREQARKDLPLSTYTEAYWKIDLHNLLHFLGLRMDNHAQAEIREYAIIIGEQIVKPLFPIVWAAFNDYRFKAMQLSRLDIEVIKRMQQRAFLLVMTLPFSQQLFNDCMDESWKGLKRCRERDECLQKLKQLGLMQDEP